MRGMIVGVWTVVVAMILAGCEMSAAPVPMECRVLGAQCRLASGPLGVCENVACKDGQAGPCFHCTDQH